MIGGSIYFSAINYTAHSKPVDFREEALHGASRRTDILVPSIVVANDFVPEHHFDLAREDYLRTRGETD